MAQALIEKYQKERSNRIENNIGVEDMPESPDIDEIMKWAAYHIEAQHKVMVRQCDENICLRVDIEKLKRLTPTNYRKVRR